MSPRAGRGSGRGQAGFSYVEVLLATVLVAACLAPALEALQVGLRGAAVHRDLLLGRYAVEGRLEEVLAEPFGSLEAAAVAAGSRTAPTSYSAAPLIVYLARYDGDNADGDGDPFTGGDDGLLWVRVELSGTAHALETLTSP